MKNNEELDKNLVTFLQYGAVPHFIRHIQVYLERCFPNSWIGTHRDIDRSLRSPGLSSKDVETSYIKGLYNSTRTFCKIYGNGYHKNVGSLFQRFFSSKVKEGFCK